MFSTEKRFQERFKYSYDYEIFTKWIEEKVWEKIIDIEPRTKEIVFVNPLFDKSVSANENIYYDHMSLVRVRRINKETIEKRMLTPFNLKKCIEIESSKLNPDHNIFSSTDFLNEVVKNHILTEDFWVNKIIFEEYLIEKYQPAAVIVCGSNDDEIPTSINEFATENGVANYFIPVKFELRCQPTLGEINE